MAAAIGRTGRGPQHCLGLGTRGAHPPYCAEADAPSLLGLAHAVPRAIERARVGTQAIGAREAGEAVALTTMPAHTCREWDTTSAGRSPSWARPSGQLDQG